MKQRAFAPLGKGSFQTVKKPSASSDTVGGRRPRNNGEAIVAVL